MSPPLPIVTIVAVVCALIAVVLFLAGYLKGFSASIDDFDAAAQDAPEDASRGYIWAVCAAVVGAGVVIALLGVSPVFIALAPFLSIVSAAVIGLLFFIEPRLR
jgi:hypothetical protein